MTDYDLDTDKDRPYRDEAVLRRLYVDEELSQREIADELGTYQSTIQRWMEKFDINSRDQIEAQITDDRLLDAEWLRKRYHGEGMVAREVADLIGCTKATVLRALDRAGIEKHSQAVRKKTIHPTFDINSWGYVRVTSHNYVNGELESTDQLGVHQLLAIAEGADPEKVFSGGDYHVHHESEVPWDNRPENIELVSEEEHHSHHSDIYWGNKERPDL